MAGRRGSVAVAKTCRKKRCTRAIEPLDLWAGGSSMQCRLRSLAMGLAALAASTVIAADHPVAGDKLLLKDPVGKPDKRVVQFKANRDFAIDLNQVGDPRLLGALVEFTGGGGGDGATGPIALPAGAFWKGLG